VICGQIIAWGEAGETSQVFNASMARRIRYLMARVRQLEIVTETFIADMDRAVKRGDDVSKRQLLDAQRINTFWTSALLLPNLLFAFFGQSFPNFSGEDALFWRISAALLFAYSGITIVFLARRTRRGA
jgi:Mg2+ and Co2+ transporter CorA